MSKRRELGELLKSIGAVFVRHGADEVWQIGNQIITLGHAITKGRQFRNYRAKIIRTAREEGLLAPRPEKVGPSLTGRQEVRRPALMAGHTRRAQPARPDEIIAWNIAEDERWRSARRGENDMEETGAARPRAMRVDERMPMIDRALNESDHPLTAVEICKSFEWSGQSDYRAVLNILRSRPGKYQPTGKRQRREGYSLRLAEVSQQVLATTPPAGDETTGVASGAAAAQAGGAPQAEALTAPADLRLALQRIRAVVDEAVAANIDPMRAAFALGRIAEIVDAVPVNRPATE